MQSIIEIRTIEYMLAIEREGSFQKAAEALYISQPALSQYIKRIESTLDFPLYEREKGKCVPTEAGKVLLGNGKKLIEDYYNMLDKMKDVSGIREVKVGWPTGYTVRFFNKLLSYMTTCNMVKLQVTEDTVDNLTLALLQGQLDIILVPVIYTHPNLVYTTIQHEEFHLAIPKNHIAYTIAEHNQVSGYVGLAQYLEMPFVTVDAAAYQNLFFSLFEEYDRKPDILFTTKDWGRAFLLSEQGCCLAILPYWYAKTDSKELAFFRIKSKHRNYRTFGYALNKKLSITHEMRLVIDYMLATYGDQYAGSPVPQEAFKINYHF